jgi:hypothetical protein
MAKSRCTPTSFSSFCSLQQDMLTDQHSFLDDLCSLAGAAALSPLLQVSMGQKGTPNCFAVSQVPAAC